MINRGFVPVHVPFQVMLGRRIGGGWKGVLALVGLGAAMIQAFQPPLLRQNMVQSTVRPASQTTRTSPLFAAPMHRR